MKAIEARNIANKRAAVLSAFNLTEIYSSIKKECEKGGHSIKVDIRFMDDLTRKILLDEGYVIINPDGYSTIFKIKW